MSLTILLMESNFSKTETLEEFEDMEADYWIDYYKSNPIDVWEP